MFRKKPKLELNEQFQKAFELMEYTDKHIFITGRAGTGKSTLLQYFRDHTKKEIVVLAPTGVAAVNVGGQTIHSFFQFKPDVNERLIRRLPLDEDENIYKELQTIVIDEISMVRADLIDYIDKFLRLNGPDKKKPFGGIQMIFIGDLYQLPPVLTNAEKELFMQRYDSQYFFSAHVFVGTKQALLLQEKEQFLMEFIELEKIYRQRDSEFIDLLNAVRNHTATHEHLSYLNERLDTNYVFDREELAMYITTTNAMAKNINDRALSMLKGKDIEFEGVVRGRFEQSAMPTDEVLRVKVGAQVMLLNNDTQGRWINGTIGKILEVIIDEESGKQAIVVELENGAVVEVLPYKWDMYEYTFDKKNGHVEPETVGSFTQYPMKLAWAITIHKAQGKTFERVILDIGNGTFAPGQLYVALSRCTTFEGLTLTRQIYKRHIMMNWDVVRFLSRFQGKSEGVMGEIAAW